MASDDTPSVQRVLGAVLTGGASTRMGRDKALVEVDGVPMAERVAAAMRAAGARRVARIGGATGDVVDAFPGEGPLGGILTALRWAGDDVVLVAPCDMPWITATHIRALLECDADVVYARGAHLVAAWRPSALASLEIAFAEGERSPRRVLTRLGAVAADVGDGDWSRDVDSPADLP